MAYNARNLLTIGQPSFMENWICPAPFDETSSPDIKRQKMLMKFKEQMYRYNYHAPQQTRPFSKSRTGFTGKVDADGKFSTIFKDDVIVCLCWNLYLLQLLREHRVPGQPLGLV